MASKEEQETLRLLVQHVSRAFYEPKYTIILDQLARHPVLKDDDLAGRMGLQSKELNKLMAVLSNDRLVKVYRQNELKEGAQRSVGKQYYYIDYENFCNVAKWRVAKMFSIIDNTLRNELEHKGYICTQCKHSYNPLDVDKLLDPVRGEFVCEICHGEVVDNENAESVIGSKDRMQRFNNQMRFIRDGLQKSEAMVLPAFDVAAWVQSNTVSVDAQKSASTESNGLKIAGSDPSQRKDDGIGVMISMDKDEHTKKMERDAEAAAKRQQNALPSWHLKSTISGDLTALGIKESAREQVLGTGSNDDLLKGLGIVGGSKPDQTSIVVEDVKPVVNEEVDYYDRYYASLAASANASAQATPSATSAPWGEEFNANEDEDDVKPSVEYLDSLNDYRKRSRSREDEGPVLKAKLAKVDSLPSLTSTNGSGHANGMIVETSPDTNGGGSQGDPIVYVNGKPVPYSQVTEEDHDLMTPDEYTAFFEVMQAHS
ncbi:hypothetical protein ONZ45_g5796 [Pleurotus djamor]|nr:hypothetical protein ONZ45_g5796 [Pleurotus djamor]